MVDEICDNLTVNKNSNMLGDLSVKGNVGIDGTVVGVNATRIKFGLEKNGGGQLVLANNPNDNMVYLEAFDSVGNGSASKMVLSGGWSKNVPVLAINADNTVCNGNVDISANSSIKLGLEKNGGGQLIIGNNPNDNMIYLEAFDSAGNGSASKMVLSGKWGSNVPVLALNADNTICSGNINVTGDVLLTGGDCAEDFDITGVESVEPGTVMVIDDGGSLKPSQQAYDKRVAGVISGAGDYRPGITLDKQNNKGNRLPLALTGKVYCKVDAEYNPIEVGDLLTTSPTIGHAMKVSDHIRSLGAIIGKALRPLKTGQDFIPILVSLQ